MTSKYYAFYIPPNKPVYMDNFKQQLDQLTDNVLCVNSNLYLNDWKFVLPDSNNPNSYFSNSEYFNSLVIVKYTDANELFKDSNGNIDLKDYIPSIKFTETCDKKMIRYADYGYYKLGMPTFTGNNAETNHLNFQTCNYILGEAIVISTPSYIIPENTNINNEKFNALMKEFDSSDDIVYNIIGIVNKLKVKLINSVKFEKDYESYNHLQHYIPLEEENNEIVIDLWNKIKQGDLDSEPYSFLEKYDEMVNGFGNSCNSADNKHFYSNYNYANLYVGCKSFDKLTYQDALPYKNNFIVKESTLRDVFLKHNQLVGRINSNEDRIRQLKSVLAKQRAPDAVATIQTQINDAYAEINRIRDMMSSLNPYYKEHILNKTIIGYRLTCSQALESHKALLYLRPAITNKDRLNNDFVFRLTRGEHMTDKIQLYISKRLSDKIINLRSLPINILNLNNLFTIDNDYKYQLDNSFNFKNEYMNNKHILPEIGNGVGQKLNDKIIRFLDTNINLKLFDYQKNNVIWMSKVEEMADNGQLVLNSLVPNNYICPQRNFSTSDFITILKKSLGEVHTYNYILKLNNEKYYLDMNFTDSNVNLSGLLSSSRRFNNRSMELPTITTIQKYDNFIASNKKSITFCGGAICDEVGLGKTLSVISHLVVKMQADMAKYNKCCNEVYNGFIVDDPYHHGFEYNNLVIVPSRLTSQWDSEIVKYVKDKFNLRAKVLVSINSIKGLEKELSEHYKKLDVERAKNLGKTKNKANAKTTTKPAKKKKTIIPVVSGDIPEPNLLVDNEPSKPETKESKKFAKLMNQAKKAREKAESRKKTLPEGAATDTTATETTDTLHNYYLEEQLYDVYIVSINLLNNANYLCHINFHTLNNLDPHISIPADANPNISLDTIIKKLYENIPKKKPLCRVEGSFDKFDILRIKWNRIILDEAHERLHSQIKLLKSSSQRYDRYGTQRMHQEDQFMYENLCTLNSNYKWVMTGTPAERGMENIMSIMQFLTKRDIYESTRDRAEKIRFYTNLVGIDFNDLKTFFGQVFKKTSKTDVKALINIPLFGEEIIMVEQNNIERNIYNTIRCSNHFTVDVRLRRLFLMCTNILINEGYDFAGENDIASNEILTLEQLNANMIQKFTQQLASLDREENVVKDKIKLTEKMIDNWKRLIDYVHELHLEDVIRPEVYNEIVDRFSNTDRPMVKQYLEVFIGIIEAFHMWADPSLLGYNLYNNLDTIAGSLHRVWKLDYSNEAVLTRLGGWSSKIGQDRNKDLLVKHQRSLDTLTNNRTRIRNQITLFSSNEFLKEKTADPCIICFDDLKEVVVTPCRHIFCLDCTKRLSNNLKSAFNCPECRTPTQCGSLNITTVDIINQVVVPIAAPVAPALEPGPANPVQLSALETKLGADWKSKCINKYGSKMAALVEYLYKLFEKPENRVIIFSQYDKMLRMIGTTLDEFAVKYVYCCGNNYVLNRNINKFKKDESIRVIMLSSETSNSGSNLTEANFIIFIDVLFHDQQATKAIEAQAIGRAVRLGQKLPVKVVRFITKDTVEEEYYNKNKYDMNSIQ